MMISRLAMALPLLLAAPAAAAPWLDAGDAVLRRDVEQLAAAGLIEGPINTWPRPVQQVCARRDWPSSPAVAAAARRVDAVCRAQTKGTGARASLATDPPLLRGFEAAPRAATDLTAWASAGGDRLHIRLGVGQRDGKLNAEPSYAALELNGWTLYGGYVEHWWGPGRDTALLLSTNAPPFPKLGIRRTAPATIDLPLLRALGPVDIELFAGVLTEHRRDFDNPALIGMRAAFAPAPGLEIGLSRTLQLCGSGRPCSLRMLANGLIGVGNRDNSGTADEPGNQLAGIDVSFRRDIGPMVAHVYGEAGAEDENNLIIEQFARLLGAELSGPAGADGATWQLHAEFVDTLAIKLDGSKTYPGSFYNHHIYTDGYRYRGRALGSSLDGDGRSFVIGFDFTDSASRRLRATWRTATLNRSSTASNPLTKQRAGFDELIVGAGLPVSATGSLRFEAAIADRSVAGRDVVPGARLAVTLSVSGPGSRR